MGSRVKEDDGRLVARMESRGKGVKKVEWEWRGRHFDALGKQLL